MFQYLQELAVARETISELEESHEDWKEEAETLTEELAFLHSSWDRALTVNAELSTRLQALIALSRN